MKRARLLVAAIVATLLVATQIPSSPIRFDPLDAQTALAVDPAVTISLAGPTNVAAGDVVQYTITVHNNTASPQLGASVAFNINGSANLLTGTQYIGSDAYNCVALAPGNVPTIAKCDPINLGPNQNISFHFSVRVNSNVPCGFAFDAIIDLNSTQPNPPTPATWSNAVHTVVGCNVDMSAMKTGPATVGQNGLIIYSAWAINNGGGTAHTIVATDPIPAGLTFSPADSSSSCTQQGNNIVCTASTLTVADQKVGWNIAFRVPANATCGAQYNNTFSVQAAENDPIPANNTQTTPVVTTVSCQTSNADLSVTKTGTPTTVVRGNNVTYTVNATNAGPAAVNNVVVRDTIPAGVTFVPAASSNLCSQNGGEIVCTNFSLASGETRPLTIVFNVPQIANCTDSQIQNIVNIAPAQAANVVDPNANNNSNANNPTVTNVQCGTVVQQFTVTKTDNRQTAAPGETLFYTITIINNLSTQATGVTVTDTLNPALSFIAASDGGTAAGQIVTWNNLTVPANGQKTITLNARIADATGNGTVISNTAVVNGSFTGSDNTTVSGNGTGQQFTVTKTDNKLTAAPGETLAYTIVITNTLNTQATGVSVVDVLNSNLTFQSASDGGTANGQTVTWSNLTIGANSSRTLVLYAVVNNNAVNGTVIANTATVNSSFTGTDTTTVSTGNNGQQFTVAKTDNKTTAAPGETLTYTITITNLFNTQATNVTVTDAVPAGVTALAASDGGTANGQTITWSNITVPANGTKTLTLVASVNNNVANGTVLTNTATVNNAFTATDITTVSTGNTGQQFTVTKTDNQTTVTPGQTYSYTIIITNNFGTQATGVTVTDALPSNISFVSASDGGTLNGSTVTWSNLTVNANSTRTLTLTVRVNDNAPNGFVISNSAVVNGSFTGTDTTTIGGGGTGNLSITKTDGRTTVGVNETLTYTITLTNSSSTSVSNVSITDTLPTGQLTFISASDGGTLNGSIVTWTGLFVGANSTRSVTLQARTNSNLTNGTQIYNSATVSTGGTATDVSSVTNGGTGGTDTCTITITDSPDPVQPGELLTYTIRITNNTSNSTSNQTANFVLPSGVNYLSSSSGGDERNGLITWNNQFLSSFETRVFTVTGRVSNSADDGDTLRSSAYCGGSSDDESTRVRDDDDDNDDDRECDDGRDNDGDGYRDYPSDPGCSSRNDDSEDSDDDDHNFAQCDDGRDNDGDGYRDYPSDPDCSSRNDNSEFNDNNGGNDQSNVSVQKTADRTVATPGESIFYTITIRNTSQSPAQNLVVQDIYQPNQLTVSDLGSGVANAGSIRWTIPSLAPGEVRTFSYRATVNGGVPFGQAITNSVSVTASNLNGTANAVTTIYTSQPLPQTGPGDFFSPLENTAAFLSPFRGGASGGTPGIVWATVVLMGLAGGVGVGRKFFI